MGGILADEMGMGKTIQSIGERFHPTPFRPLHTAVTLIQSPRSSLYRES